MRETIDRIADWLDSGQSIALASVIKTWGSSPRPVGAVMAVTQDGQIAGSVSGGCVEGAVIEAAQTVIKKNQPLRLQYGVADAEAWEVGLSCGGEIEIFIRPFFYKDLQNWIKALDSGRLFCSVLIINSDGEDIGQEFFLFQDGTYNNVDLQSGSMTNLMDVAGKILLSGKSTAVILPGAEHIELFVTVLDLPLELILVGGVHLALPLVSLAEIMGFNITVIDPRRLFSSKERFPTVKLIQEWPSTAFKKFTLSSSSAVVMLTHDPKIDDPAILLAMDSDAFYIGALGSKNTHQKRVERLREAGVTEENLARIHAPVGLDLGGRLPPGDRSFSHSTNHRSQE